jgi:hypothetical protein
LAFKFFGANLSISFNAKISYNVRRTRTKARLSSALNNPTGLPRFCAAAVAG